MRLMAVHVLQRTMLMLSCFVVTAAYCWATYTYIVHGCYVLHAPSDPKRERRPSQRWFCRHTHYAGRAWAPPWGLQAVGLPGGLSLNVRPGFLSGPVPTDLRHRTPGHNSTKTAPPPPALGHSVRRRCTGPYTPPPP